MSLKATRLLQFKRSVSFFFCWEKYDFLIISERFKFLVRNPKVFSNQVVEYERGEEAEEKKFKIIHFK
jgi:hypothetical protein